MSPSKARSTLPFSPHSSHFAHFDHVPHIPSRLLFGVLFLRPSTLTSSLLNTTAANGTKFSNLCLVWVGHWGSVASCPQADMAEIWFMENEYTNMNTRLSQFYRIQYPFFNPKSYHGSFLRGLSLMFDTLLRFAISVNLASDVCF